MIPTQHAPIVAAALAALESTRSTTAHRTICDRLAHEAYTRGRSDALLGLRTLAEAAAELDLHPITVRQVAARLQLGWRPQRGVLLLTREDIERIRTRPRGRPGPKPRTSLASSSPGSRSA